MIVRGRELTRMSELSAPTRQIRAFRLMLGFGAGVYLAWWFAVEQLLPGSFNPLPGRLLVVAYFAVAFGLTYVSRAAERRAGTLFYLGALALVGHYFYLFHHNAQDLNWVVGTYVVVFALCVGVQSSGWLTVFAVFSFGCGLAVWLLQPALQRSIFLPGLATILMLCLVMSRSRLRLVESLSESTARFQGLFDASFEGVAVHDRGRIIDVNASFVALFGYTREELAGRSVIDLTAPEQRELVAQQIGAASESRYESMGLRKDGSRFPMEVSAKPHVYRGRALRIAAVRDISDRQRAEEERLRLIQEQAARANAQETLRLRDEFISIASHELRTPIASLLLHLDAFARADPSSQNFDMFSSRTRRQLGRMTRLVEALVNVPRLEAGHLTLQRELVDLEAVVRSVVDSLAADLQRAGCRAEIRSSGALEGFWDRVRLEQVVENLARNAMTYGAGKPIELLVRGEPEGHVLLGIRDYGIGIDKPLQEKVFQRFERAVSARHYGGLGLGLYIVKQIVEAHHGTVRVESEIGKGATFWVDLPVHSPSVGSA
jgi:PAS domain S-box-containing protein